MPSDLKEHILNEVKKAGNVGQVVYISVSLSLHISYTNCALVGFDKLDDSILIRRRLPFWRPCGFHVVAKMSVTRRTFHQATSSTTQVVKFMVTTSLTEINQTISLHFWCSNLWFPRHHVSSSLRLIRKSPNIKLMTIYFQGHTVINVECRAWARNIHYDRQSRLGSTHFEILVD